VHSSLDQLWSEKIVEKGKRARNITILEKEIERGFFLLVVHWFRMMTIMTMLFPASIISV
jgi:hypothetical protein